MTLSNPVSFISTTLCSFGFLFTLLIISVMLKYRDTPIVKASNFNMSTIHLIFTSLQFIVVPLLFIGEETSLKCYFKPTSILLLWTFPALVIVIKSQNALMIFKAKGLLSDTEKANSTIIKFSIITFVVITNSAVLIWSILAYPPKILTEINHTTFTIASQCNTGLHTNLQIFFLIMQHLFSAVQAFRGRNLPGPFNEAMLIAYSTLTVTFTYVVIFPIYYLQGDDNVRRTVHLITLPIAQTLFLFIFYGPKVYTILFKRHKNTKSYFRAQMWKRSLDQADKLH